MKQKSLDKISQRDDKLEKDAGYKAIVNVCFVIKLVTGKRASLIND